MKIELLKMYNNYPVVTGLGILTALGNSVENVIENMKKETVNCGSSKRFKGLPFDDYAVFEAEFQSNAEFHSFSRTTQMLFFCFFEAMNSAGLKIDDLKNISTGILIGTTEGTALNIMNMYRIIKGGGTSFGKEHIDTLRKYLDSNPAMALSAYLREKGVSISFVHSITNACSSGTDAIGLGSIALRETECELVIAGGTDSFSDNTFAGFISLLNSDKKPCRPFDKTRGGLSLGEGAGVVIMEKPSLRVTKNKEYGKILGYGTCGDAYHLTAPCPDGAGLRVAIDRALKSAGKKYEDIAFINAHGTGTEANDLTELEVINDKFSRKTPFLSTKGYTGHTLGAAGAVEAIISMAHLNDGLLPKCAGFSEPVDQFCHCEPTKEITKINGDTALSFSLAFGGNNSALVLGL